ncbi:MAG: tRNA (N6-threonylcarbamoyladenosine(37)-N6)-methyltransferase TrmO [Candidatus Thorarchaeota archaeon]
MQISMHPIGVIRSPYSQSENTPIQPCFSDEIGYAEIEEEYVDGLESLDGFSHIILLYWCHRARLPRMKVTPYLDKREHGLFATRAPSRPNPIGFSIVKLLKIEGNRLTFGDTDILDETPLLDIKPYVPKFDNRPDATSGWLTDSLSDADQRGIADSRFH